MSKRHDSPVQIPVFEYAACTENLRKQILRNNPLFSGLEYPDIKTVNSYFSSQHFDKGASIIQEGQAADRFYIIASGTAKLTGFQEPDRILLHDILSIGDYFGAIAGFGNSPEEYKESVICNSPVCTISIDTSAFRSILTRYPDIALQAVHTFSKRLSLAYEMIGQMGGSSVEKRIAFVLLRLSKKLGRCWEDKTLIYTPLTREDLASMVSTSVESCSRVMSDMKRQGLVDTGRAWVAIRDAAALESLL